MTADTAQLLLFHRNFQMSFSHSKVVEIIGCINLKVLSASKFFSEKWKDILHVYFNIFAVKAFWMISGETLIIIIIELHCGKLYSIIFARSEITRNNVIWRKLAEIDLIDIHWWELSQQSMPSQCTKMSAHTDQL